MARSRAIAKRDQARDVILGSISISSTVHGSSPRAFCARSSARESAARRVPTRGRNGRRYIGRRARGSPRGNWLGRVANTPGMTPLRTPFPPQAPLNGAPERDEGLEATARQ